MNAPLPVLKTAPSKLSHDLPTHSAGRNRADDARTLRRQRADHAPRDRFSDLLKKASDRSSLRADENRKSASGDQTVTTNRTDHPTVDDAAGAAQAQPPQTDASEHRAGDSSGSSAHAGDDGATSAETPGATTGAVRADESEADAARTAPSGAEATRLQGGAAQPDGWSAQDARPDSVAQQQVVKQQAERADAAANAGRLTAPQAVNTSPQTQTSADTTAGAAQQQSQQAASNVTQQNADSRVARVESGNTNVQATNAAATPNNAASGHSAAGHDSGAQSQQQSGGDRATQQLKQQVLQAAEQAGSHAAEETPAVRRSGQVNAQVQAEHATGARTVSIDSLTQHTATSASTTPQPTLEPAAAARVSVQPAQTTGGQIVDDAQATSNVVRGMSALVNQRGGVMHMRLEPPELGQLRVQMTIARGTVSAQFHAATAQAQQVLERNMTTLRTALERHGLTVEKITVHTQQPAQSNNASNQQMNHQSADHSGQNNHHDAGDGASRGRDEQSSGGEQQGRRRDDQPFDNLFAQQHERSFGEAAEDAGAVAGVAS